MRHCHSDRIKLALSVPVLSRVEGVEGSEAEWAEESVESAREAVPHSMLGVRLS